MVRYLAVRMILAAFLCAVPARLCAGEPAVIVELVPDNPGPYAGGEAFTVHLWLHSQVDYWAPFEIAAFDFSESDDLVPTNLVEFDYSTLVQPDEYFEGSTFIQGPPTPCQPGATTRLPRPWLQTAGSALCYPCPEYYLSIPPQGSLEIAQIEVQLPSQAGSYRLDALNAGDPQPLPCVGAVLALWEAPFHPPPVWRATGGQIAGNPLVFHVRPIPAMSAWGTALLMVALLSGGSWVIARRRRSARSMGSPHVCFRFVPFQLGPPVEVSF